MPSDLKTLSLKHLISSPRERAHPATALAQCSECKDTFTLMWSYQYREWEKQQAFVERKELPSKDLYHKISCGGKLNIWMKY